MRFVGVADAFQQRHRWVGMPLAVVYKYADDQGGFLAALITYYAFLSLFPALLLLVTALGYVLAGNPTAQQNVLDSALSQFPVIGTQLEHNLSSLQATPPRSSSECLGFSTEYSASGRPHNWRSTGYGRCRATNDQTR